MPYATPCPTDSRQHDQVSRPEAPTDHWIETATELGATGVEVMVAHVAGRPLQAHRMIPLHQISSDPETLESYADDLDVLLEGDATFWADQTLRELAASPLASARLNCSRRSNTDFQFTRGLLGVSM